jgi:hypothetical protein
MLKLNRELEHKHQLVADGVTQDYISDNINALRGFVRCTSWP